MLQGTEVFGLDFLTVPMKDGYVALVDPADWPLVMRYTWHAELRGKTFYAQAYAGGGRGGPKIFMHRLIMGCTYGDGVTVDHRRHNGLDNRRSEMRIASQSQQNQNSRPRKSRTGFKGVHPRRGGFYCALIQIDRRTRHVGSYRSPEAAARAYDAAARELFGEFARTNF